MNGCATGSPGFLSWSSRLLALAGIVWLFISGIETREDSGARHHDDGRRPFPLWVFLMSGFFMVAPNEAKVLQLFGDYVGTAKVPGLRYANPVLQVPEAVAAGAELRERRS